MKRENKNDKKKYIRLIFGFGLRILLMFFFILIIDMQLVMSKDSVIKKFHNYPNPFQRSSEVTQIVCEFNKPAEGTLKIFDLSGQLIWQKRIRIDDSMISVENVVVWNGRSKSGEFVSHGVYLCRLQVKTKTKSVDFYETRTIKIGVKR